MAPQRTSYLVLCILLAVAVGLIKSDEGGATETQTAQCTITSGDVKASAQASVTTRLEGICETPSMMTAFHLLESRLLIELYNIRIILSQIQNPNYSPLQHSQFMFPHVNLNPTLYHKIAPPPSPPKEKPSSSSASPPDTNAIQVIPQRNVSIFETTSLIPNATSTTTLPPPPQFVINQTTSPLNTQPTTESTEKIIAPRPSLFPFLKSLPSSRKILSGPRDFEIYKFNNTILSGKEAQVFTYFWKIENYTERVKSLEQNSTDLSSPAFVISGFNLRIKASLNHLNRDYLYLRLEEVPKNDMADLSSVILETGDLFHEIESSSMFRYKITVLDQSPLKNDLVSQEFTDTTSGFMIPSSALTATDTYTKDNLILIKVILYL